MTNEQTLRLQIASTIHIHDEYAIKGLESQGFDPKELTHVQIATYKASMQLIHADILIDLSKRQSIVEPDVVSFFNREEAK